jgi:hypothetical protein
LIKFPNYKKYISEHWHESIRRNKDFPSITEEQYQWILKRIESRLSNEDLADMFKYEFNKVISDELIRRIRIKNGIRQRPRKDSKRDSKMESPKPLSQDQKFRILDERIQKGQGVNDEEYSFWKKYRLKHGWSIW